jgi:hypothetical protein
VLYLLAPDQVVHLTMHAVKHNFELFVWLADILGWVARWGEA